MEPGGSRWRRIAPYEKDSGLSPFIPDPWRGRHVASGNDNHGLRDFASRRSGSAARQINGQKERGSGNSAPSRSLGLEPGLRVL